MALLLAEQCGACSCLLARGGTLEGPFRPWVVAGQLGSEGEVVKSLKIHMWQRLVANSAARRQMESAPIQISSRSRVVVS